MTQFRENKMSEFNVNRSDSGSAIVHEQTENIKIKYNIK